MSAPHFIYLPISNTFAAHVKITVRISYRNIISAVLLHNVSSDEQMKKIITFVKFHFSIADLMVQARPKLQVAAKYALHELTPPKLSDIPAIRAGE